MSTADPKRKQIREAIKGILLGNTDAAQNVYSNRMSAFWREELPSISVYFTDEDKTPRDVQNKKYSRSCLIQIETHVEGNEQIDDSLDRISEQVESALLANQSLNGLVQGLVLQSESFQISEEGTKPTGLAVLTIQVTYSK